MVEDDPETIKAPKDLWYHRRVMAYTALVGLLSLAGAGALGYTPEGAAPIVQSAIWACVGVIFAYVANCAVEDYASVTRKE